MDSSIDSRVAMVSHDPAFRQVEPASVLVCKAAFADGDPAENYGRRATNQSCEEHNFKHSHREYGQS
jgi:hypothetical protein